jgi:hypothetical protein
MFKKMSEYVILFPEFQEENTDFVGSLKRNSILRNKKKVNFQHFVPEHFASEKTARNSVLWNKNSNNFSVFCSKLFYVRKKALNSAC